MRDIRALVEREEIHQHMLQTWRTDLFRQSHLDGGPVFRLIDRFADVPRFIHTMDYPDIERGHFLPWFGSIGLREYENAAVHDLFYYHEIYHMATLTYDSTVSWEEWEAKMAMNEIRASVNSEALIYFSLPGLRGLSFPREIWVDRFLGRRQPVEEADLLIERWRATLFPRDAIEQRIALFQTENRRWAELWKERWRDPEAAMERLIRTSRTDRQRAAAEHLEWLQAGITDPSRPYPFPEEAEAFARIYWETRQREQVMV